jgi:hypothetical protein
MKSSVASDYNSIVISIEVELNELEEFIKSISDQEYTMNGKACKMMMQICELFREQKRGKKK